MKITRIYKELYKKTSADPTTRNLISVVDEVFKECKQKEEGWVSFI